MKLKSLVMTMAIALLVSAPSYAQWYNGGNLHRATVAEWRKASYENRLATAADWFVGITQAHNIEMQKKMEALPGAEYLKQLKISATKLELCVSDATASIPGHKDIYAPTDSIAQVAAICYGSIFGFK